MATSPANWDSRFPSGDEDTVNTMSTAGVMHTGDNPSDPAQAYVAPVGSYTLELVAFAGDGTCSGSNNPDFGYNQNGALGYIILGTG